ncbi:hypothetical protein [Microbacterium sp. C7(2022)]|uniref:hypothetical protein n=1 Tax=Microbacterium sp. C7(2022) TaxID=2992759 RepID=UPI00237B81E2|nr:hypothetical protein [Microbacterium sp. C7(2022)]MDE0546335.1 hypothetical protein [Microbacterium sp. C7(2022)]
MSDPDDPCVNRDTDRAISFYVYGADAGEIISQRDVERDRLERLHETFKLRRRVDRGVLAKSFLVKHEALPEGKPALEVLGS